jgi:hypothetical protein
VRSEVTSSGVVPVLLLALLVALLLVTLRVRGRARRITAVLLVPVSFAWVLFNGRLEGPVLLDLSQNHGVTVADLLAVLGVLVAGVVLVRRAEEP